MRGVTGSTTGVVNLAGDDSVLKAPWDVFGWDSVGEFAADVALTIITFGASKWLRTAAKADKLRRRAARIKELHDKDEKFCEYAVKLAAKLDAMAHLSTYLDDNTVAQAYAKDLLEVIKPALQVDMIRTSLGIHPDTLSETVAEIAKHK